MNKKYIPVDPDYLDMIEKEKAKNKEANINFFKPGNKVENIKDTIEEISTNNGNEDYLKLKSNDKIRLDHIITVNGKPGPAFEEYDSFADACLDCMGGMED